MDDVDDVNEAPEMIVTAAGWRMALSAGFLDGDAGRQPAVNLWSYAAGWKAGRSYSRLRARIKAA